MRRHQIHVVARHKQHDFTCWRFVNHEGTVQIPATMLFQADWVYDISVSRVLKNKTDQSCFPAICAEEVDDDWLAKEGYIRRQNFDFGINFAQRVLNPQGVIKVNCIA